MSDTPDPSTPAGHCPECGSRNPNDHRPTESHLTPGVTALCTHVWHLQSDATPMLTQPSAPLSLRDVISNLDELVRNDLMDAGDAWDIMVKHAGTIKFDPKGWPPPSSGPDFESSQDHLKAALDAAHSRPPKHLGHWEPVSGTDRIVDGVKAARDRVASLQTWVDHPGMPLRHHVHEDVDKTLSDHSRDLDDAASSLKELSRRVAALDNQTEKLAGELRQQGKNHTKGMNTLEHVFREYLDMLYGWAARIAHDVLDENDAPPAPPW